MVDEIDERAPTVDTVAYTLRLRAFVHQQGNCWESLCPSLDVYSQGDSEEEAKSNLLEAVQLWIESCVERNTLPAALQELGWQRVPDHLAPPPDTESIKISALDEASLGNPFPVEITIPAYQAAMFSGESGASPC